MSSKMDLFSSVKALLHAERVTIDHKIFKLHCRYTVILLILFSLFVTTKQYFGDPINCEEGPDRSKEVMDSYCWIFSTYIIGGEYMKVTQGKEPVVGIVRYATPVVGIAPGVKPHSDEDIIIRQKYYQWIYVILCIQAMLFYLPKYIWSGWEAGRMASLVKDLGGPLCPKEWNDGRRNLLVKYFLRKSSEHTAYTLRFLACEVFALANVIGQILVINHILGGMFLSYGLAAVFYDAAVNPTELSPMDRVFPKLAKCTLYNYGPSGSKQTLDSLCVLALNVVNEKIFAFMWFWFVILLLVTVFSLFYRAAIVSSKRFRVMILMGHDKFLSKGKARLIVKKLSYCDFHVLCQVGVNVNSSVFHDLLDEMCIKLRGSIGNGICYGDHV